MLILLGFAFLAGIVTILSPCILPILPIVLSGTIAGSKKRPLGIILGFVLSFTFFTLFLTKIVQLTGIPSDSLRIFAGIVLLFFGASLLIPSFQVLLEKLFTRLSRFGPKANPQAGFFGGFVIGLSIGLIWVPCVGPIMASVIALAATSRVDTFTFLITLFYALGSAIPMFFIMIGGRQLLNRAPVLVQKGELIQKGFGILMIALSIAIFFNLDRQFEAYIASTSYGANLTKLEENDTVKKQLDALRGGGSHIIDTGENNDLFNSDTKAPDFVGILKWLNTDKTFTIGDLKGKVVLVDFWTYTCINCIRTLPHVTSWYEKYKDQGFVVIGVHTPEFAFEKETENVTSAIKQYNINYPVAQDNDYATWNNFSNQYWPAEYLIDAKGIIRRTHFGEGEYDQMEMAIQELLKEAGKNVSVEKYLPAGRQVPDQTPTDRSISPETYVGSKRAQYYYPTSSLTKGKQNLTLSDGLPVNSFSLGGSWNIEDEYSTAGEKATLNYNFNASKVYLVMKVGSAKNAQVKVYLDGKLIDTKVSGSDVKDGIITVDSDRLYNLVDFKDKTESHILKLEFVAPGVEVFAFTFG